MPEEVPVGDNFAANTDWRLKNKELVSEEVSLNHDSIANTERRLENDLISESDIIEEFNCGENLENRKEVSEEISLNDISVASTERRLENEELISETVILEELNCAKNVENEKELVSEEIPLNDNSVTSTERSLENKELTSETVILEELNCEKSIENGQELLSANEEENASDLANENSLDETVSISKTRSAALQENFELPYFQLPKPDLESFLDETDKNMNCWQDAISSPKKKINGQVKKNLINHDILKRIAKEMPLPKRSWQNDTENHSNEIIEFTIDEGSHLNKFKQRFMQQTGQLFSRPTSKYPLKNDGLISLEARRKELKEKLERKIQERKIESFTKFQEMQALQKKYDNESEEEFVSDGENDMSELSDDCNSINTDDDTLPDFCFGTNNNDDRKSVSELNGEEVEDHVEDTERDAKINNCNILEESDDEEFVPKKISQKKKKFKNFHLTLDSSSESENEEKTISEQLYEKSDDDEEKLKSFEELLSKKLGSQPECSDKENDEVDGRITPLSYHSYQVTSNSPEREENLSYPTESNDIFEQDYDNSINMSEKSTGISQTRSGDLQLTTQEIMNMMSDGSDNGVDLGVAEDLLNCPLEKPNIGDFFEDEAELSGEDVGSDEADSELEDDENELEVIEEDLPSSEVLRDQINDLHMKQVLNDDERIIDNLKEQFLEGGEMYSDGTGRSKKFSWKNSIDLDNIANHSSSESESEVAADEGWNVINEEKIKWRQENNEQENYNISDSSYLMSLTPKLKIISKSMNAVSLEVLQSGEKKAIKRPRASIINDEGMSHVLKKLKASETSFGSRATKHFVFRNEENASSQSTPKECLIRPSKESSTKGEFVSESIFGKL